MFIAKSFFLFTSHPIPLPPGERKIRERAFGNRYMWLCPQFWAQLAATLRLSDISHITLNCQTNNHFKKTISASYGEYQKIFRDGEGCYSKLLSRAVAKSFFFNFPLWEKARVTGDRKKLGAISIMRVA
jgi:hypothetical protein